MDQLTDVVSGNPMVVRMIVQYSRRHSLRPVLGPLVERVLTDRTLLINTNPVEIYRHWVNQQEAQTGQPWCVSIAGAEQTQPWSKTWSV